MDVLPVTPSRICLNQDLEGLKKDSSEIMSPVNPKYSKSQFSDFCC